MRWMDSDQNITDIVDLLGGTAVLGKPIEDARELCEAAELGIPRVAMDSFLSKILVDIGKNQREVLESLFDVEIESDQTPPRLTVQAGKLLIRIAQASVALVGVFGNYQAVGKFLTRRHPELGGDTPIEALTTEDGFGTVEAIVNRGLHGLPV